MDLGGRAVAVRSPMWNSLRFSCAQYPHRRTGSQEHSLRYSIGCHPLVRVVLAMKANSPRFRACYRHGSALPSSLDGPKLAGWNGFRSRRVGLAHVAVLTLTESVQQNSRSRGARHGAWQTISMGSTSPLPGLFALSQWDRTLIGECTYTVCIPCCHVRRVQLSHQCRGRYARRRPRSRIRGVPPTASSPPAVVSCSRPQQRLGTQHVTNDP